MKLPWFAICGGTTGNLKPPVLVRNQNSSSVAGTQIGGGFSRQPGSSSSSGPGSITAPDRTWAPMVEAFSITQTVVSGDFCFNRMAKDRPAGPAPTTTTSYSITSRSDICGDLGSGIGGVGRVGRGRRFGISERRQFDQFEPVAERPRHRLGVTVVLDDVGRDDQDQLGAVERLRL